MRGRISDALCVLQEKTGDFTVDSETVFLHILRHFLSCDKTYQYSSLGTFGTSF